MDMRDDDAHGADIKRALDKPSTALMRNPDKGRDAGRDGRDADLGRIAQGHAGVLQIDEQGVIAGRFGDMSDLDAAADLDAERGTDLAVGGETEEVVLGDGGRGCHSDKASEYSFY